MKNRILKKMLKVICYIGIVCYISFKFALSVSKNKDAIIQKYKTYYMMMISWMDILENRKKIGDYLKKKGYYKIGVYGTQDAGWHLVKQLQGTEISVEYAIDRFGGSGKLDMLPVYQTDAYLPKADVIIVTPVWDYQNIKKSLLVKNNYPIVSLQEIIEGMRDV